MDHVLLSCKRLLLISARLASTGREDDTDNETVQGKSFRKDKDEDHADEQLWLLRIGPAEDVKEKNQILISTTSKQKVVIYRKIDIPLCLHLVSITVKQVPPFNIYLLMQ